MIRFVFQVVGMASRPLSTATTGSGELGGYYGAFEEVLAWLLEAEERLAAVALPPPADLAALKEHFHQHEVVLITISPIAYLLYMLGSNLSSIPYFHCFHIPKNLRCIKSCLIWIIFRNSCWNCPSTRAESASCWSRARASSWKLGCREKKQPKFDFRYTSPPLLRNLP